MTSPKRAQDSLTWTIEIDLMTRRSGLYEGNLHLGPVWTILLEVSCSFKSVEVGTVGSDLDESDPNFWKCSLEVKFFTFFETEVNIFVQGKISNT